MSGLDRAFIRAYAKDKAWSGLAAPHAALPVAAESNAPPPAEQSPTGAVRLYVDAPHTSHPTGPHQRVAPRPSSVPESSEGKPRVTRFEPIGTPLDWGRPAYEVDQFRWPALVGDLVTRIGAELDGTAQRLLTSSREGRQVVAIIGTGPSVGGTTLLLCLAQRMAAMKLKCAIVDADFMRPTLASMLGVTPQFGWEDIAQQDASLCDVLIESIGDGLTLLPLHRRVDDPVRLAGDLYWNVTLDALRQRYRLVLIDAGPLVSDRDAEPCWLRPQSGIDAALLVGDARDHGGHDTMADSVERLRECGIEILGVAENFCPSESKRLLHRHRGGAAGGIGTTHLGVPSPEGV